MVIETKNNHPLSSDNNNISRTDIDAIMKPFMRQVSELWNKITFEQDKTKQASSTILDYSI
jgi:hypothetical protein